MEQVAPERTDSNYWYLYKLPLSGERSEEVIFDEVEACKNANPGYHILLVSYDKLKLTQGTSMVIYSGD